MAYLQANAYAGARGRLNIIATGIMMLSLAACASVGASGPSTKAIYNAGKGGVGTADIKIVEVTDTTASQVLAAGRSALFSEALGDAPAAGTVIGYGDVL